MDKAEGLPAIGIEILSVGHFAAYVRQYVFKTQKAVAGYLGRDPATISRYEQGTLIPPIGYLAFLVKRFGQAAGGAEPRLSQSATQPREPVGSAEPSGQACASSEYHEALVDWTNQLMTKFRLTYPGEPLFRSWEHLCQVAGHYLYEQERRSSAGPPDQAKETVPEPANVAVARPGGRRWVDVLLRNRWALLSVVLTLLAIVAIVFIQPIAHVIGIDELTSEKWGRKKILEIRRCAAN